MNTPTPSPTQTPPLLPILYPYAISALHKSVHLAYAFWRYTLGLFVRFPWSTLISPLTYLLAPFTTFAAILLSFTLLTPYRLILWLLDALFPIYVLCGVACITGSILGWGGRALSLGLVRAVTFDSVKGDQFGNYEDLLMKKNDDEDFVERSAKRRRIDKKEKDGRVKFDSPTRTFAYCMFPSFYPRAVSELMFSRRAKVTTFDVTPLTSHIILYTPYQTNASSGD